MFTPFLWGFRSGYSVHHTILNLLLKKVGDKSVWTKMALFEPYLQTYLKLKTALIPTVDCKIGSLWFL